MGDRVLPARALCGQVSGAIRPTDQGPIGVIKFSPSGQHLLSAGNDGAVRMWQATYPPAHPRDPTYPPTLAHASEAVRIARTSHA